MDPADPALAAEYAFAEAPPVEFPQHHEVPPPSGPAGAPAIRASKQLVIIPLSKKGDRAGIERQLAAGHSINETDAAGNTPLHAAVEAPKNEIATVQCLLENGADANAANYLGATPLHYVSLRKSNYRGITNILLENGAAINAATLAGATALHVACENQLQELVETLCLFGADVNALDENGSAPVHLLLSREGGRDTVKQAIMQCLMQYSAWIHTANGQGYVPLHLAARSGYVRCVQLLLQQQAQQPTHHLLTVSGQSALHLACSKGTDGHAESARLLIQVFPQAIDLQDNELNTPLHICATVGNLDCALLLLKEGANTTLKNIQKKTAFEIAKIRGTDLSSTHNPELVQVLKEANKSAGCRQS
eukprot:TRINITY_DN75545_c0_g1_i1.p1 TRINITY_DN75545_c0_g1~~TRINITY_DN75545_c0_g1_i1.p1  ORF type:complete len:396 (+),score=78.27 TRINITY_DN75545_c0_g1_i1:98-1189(+)